MAKKFEQIIAKIKSIKHIEYIIVGIFAILVIAISFSSFNKDSGGTTALASNALYEYAKVQEQKLEAVLSKIEGTGKVKVMITYSSGVEIVPAYSTDKTENKNDSGQNTTERTTIITSGGKILVLTEIQPTVKGVIVVAQGASNARVKVELYKAVSTLLDVNTSKIEIFEMK